MAGMRRRRKAHSPARHYGSYQLGMLCIRRLMCQETNTCQPRTEHSSLSRTRLQELAQRIPQRLAKQWRAQSTAASFRLLAAAAIALAKEQRLELVVGVGRAPLTHGPMYFPNQVSGVWKTLRKFPIFHRPVGITFEL